MTTAPLASENLAADPILALVVGGEPAFVRDVLSPKLRDYWKGGRRLQVEWHWPWKRQPEALLPAKCDLVILCTDMVSHNQSDGAKTLAVKAGIPVIYATRKFAESIARFESAGFRREAPPVAIPIPGKPTPVTSRLDTPAPALVPIPAPVLPPLSREGATRFVRPEPPPATPPAPRLRDLNQLPVTERKRIAVAKRNLVERVLCEQPTSRNADIAARVQEMLKKDYPTVRPDSGVDPAMLASLRKEYGINATAGPEGVRKVYVSPVPYEAACKVHGIRPNYEGVIKQGWRRSSDAEIAKEDARAAAAVVSLPTPAHPVTQPAPAENTVPAASALQGGPVSSSEKSTSISSGIPAESRPRPLATTAASALQGEPAWLTKDMRAAIELLRSEMHRIGIVSIEIPETGKIRGSRRVTLLRDFEEP